MKKRFFFKSIYAKFAMIFVGIWWLMNSLTFGLVIHAMSNFGLTKWPINHAAEFFKVKQATGFVFLICTAVGTVIILLAVRSIVKPIKQLSQASKQVAKGNFDVEVKIRCADEIGQLTADFNLMTKELKTIDFLRKDFVSNVSHEFKTPITSIKGFAKLIRDGNLSEDQILEYSDIIVNESSRLSLLSSNLLKLSELDSQMIREQSAVFSLDEQIRKTILILEVQWTKKEIEFDLDLQKVSVISDEHLLQEVWLNLIQNAIKFSNPKGVIEIRLTKSGNFINVTVRDHGIGIADEDKQRIFERFYKGDKSRSKDGNGLGLVIAKKIVELSGGNLSFTSELGKGTTFTVELPGT